MWASTGGNSNLPGLASFGGEFTSSPFPALDDFLKTQINKGGVQGTLRSWQYSYRAPIGDPDPSQQQQQAPPPATSLLTYHIGRNRWCENIGKCMREEKVEERGGGSRVVIIDNNRGFCVHLVGRAHKSNHTMMVVDLRRGVFYQKCHDPDCRSYRYPTTGCHVRQEEEEDKTHHITTGLTPRYVAVNQITSLSYTPVYHAIGY